MNITEPLILSRGSHQAGSGKGCAMNVISWENGDKRITDFPACSDRFLARLVQRLNDRLADDVTGVLSGEDALLVLDLGHQTVGTTAHDLSPFDLRRVHVRIAAEIAQTVAHLDKTGTAQPCIEATLAWAETPSDEAIAVVREKRTAAAYAANGANAAAYATDATDAAANAANATAYAAYAANAANATAYADGVTAYAADATAYAADGVTAYAADGVTEWKVAMLANTQYAITRFKELTGTSSPEVLEDRVNEALRCMVAR